MKKRFDCVAKNVGCIRNSEKKAPKDPPNYNNVLKGPKSNEANKIAQ